MSIPDPHALQHQAYRHRFALTLAATVAVQALLAGCVPAMPEAEAPSPTAAGPATAQEGDRHVPAVAPAATDRTSAESDYDEPAHPRSETVASDTDKAATRPFEFQAPAPAAAPAPSECGFAADAVPANASIYAAGAYSGRRLDIQIDQSGHQATRMDVAVNSPDRPVVLMLGAYEPTVWNVGWSAGTRIAAVLIGGYHHQQVTGLPPDTPLQVSTHHNRGACGYFYVSADRAGTLNPIARRVFGRPVDMLYPARDGRVMIGAELPNGTPLVTDASARPVDSFKLRDTPLAGPAGLQAAVDAGILRKATSADTEAWLRERERHASPVDAPPIAGGAPRRRLSLHNGYVVLKAFELPAGLYGAHSATFFVPRGVPRPTGKLGHSTLYDFNTLACSGTACDRD